MIALPACATCINTADSTGVVAANGAVFVMLGAMAIAFLAVGGILFSLMRRATRHAAAAAAAENSGS
jgi:hypothetical protein